MVLGRIPACIVEPLAGNQCKRVDKASVDDNSTKKVFQPLFGNKCAHNKNNLKVPAVFGKTKSGLRLPHSISECGNRLQYLSERIRRGISKEDIASAQNKPAGMFQWYMSLYDDPRFIKFLYHINNNNKSRKRRSEGLEAALFLAFGTILSRLNLYQMAYGFPNNRNEFIFFGYERIAEESGMSLIRVKRAMKVLQDIGFFKVTTLVKTLDDGKIIHIATHIHATDMVFDFLGLMPEFLKDRETSSIKFHEKQIRLDKNKFKRDLYRKSAFSRSKLSNYGKQTSVPTSQRRDRVVDNLSEGCQLVVSKLTNPYQPQNKGRGQELKQLYANLTSQGISPAEAVQIIRSKYPPPH